jgi:two-component system, NtrC family, sensor histidine kinase HydH
LEKGATKITLIITLVTGISLLHYVTDQSRYYYHVFYGELYFLPIVLAGFWFGLRGAIPASLGITACYAPFIYWHWHGFSPDDFDRMLSVALYNLLAAFIGILKDRETIVQARLLEAKSLAAMGKSLAAVAHDMKTPLVAIGGLARRLQKKFKDDDPGLKKSEIIIRETDRLEKMMHNMLDFSKPLVLQFSKGNLNEIVQSSLIVVEGTAQNKEVTIESSISPELQAVALDAMRVEQMIVNLALNAVQASPQGEKVIIRTSIVEGDLVIDVVDCGSGISLDRRAKVFDPFFTTKRGGTGLGLAIVKKIVEAHKGSLEILDNSPKGTIFRITLPTGDEIKKHRQGSIGSLVDAYRVGKVVIGT